MNWNKYEEEKRKLQSENLNYLEYEKRLKEIVDTLERPKKPNKRTYHEEIKQELMEEYREELRQEMIQEHKEEIYVQMAFEGFEEKPLNTKTKRKSYGKKN